MKEIIVKTQKQLDDIKTEFEGTIYIEGGSTDSPLVLSRRFESAEVITRGNAVIDMQDSSVVQCMWESSVVQSMQDSSVVQSMQDSSVVQSMRDSSVVQRMRDSSVVQRMWDSSVVQDMRDSSVVQRMWDSSVVKRMRDSSVVQDMQDSSVVQCMWDSSVVQDMRDSSVVQRMWDSSVVKRMRDSSVVQDMQDSSVVQDLYGEAMVSAYGMNKVTCHGYNIVRTSESNKYGLTLVMNKDSHLIIVPEFEPNFEEFSKRYPVSVDGKTATLYKSVHKVGTQYLSDYDRSFEYVVGEMKKHDADKGTEQSCAPGLHVSEKHWAISFGFEWDDMALLECEVPIDSIVVAKDCDGKVRTSKLKVIREVPKEEWHKN